jgi:hypothetical protein
MAFLAGNLRWWSSVLGVLLEMHCTSTIIHHKRLSITASCLSPPVTPPTCSFTLQSLRNKPDVLAFTRSASHNLWYQYAVARVVAVVAVRTIPSRQSGNASYAVNVPAASNCTSTGVVLNKICVVLRSFTSFAYKPVFYKTILRSYGTVRNL